MPATRSVVTSDTVLFFPHEIQFPAVKIDDFLRQAATDLISILTNPPPSTVPSLEAGDTTKNALLKLALLLNPSDDITNKIQRQNTIALTTAQSLHRQASSSSQQPSSSTSPPRHSQSEPTSTATTPSPTTRPSPPLTILHPVLTLEQKQRLKDILTRTVTAITHDKMKSAFQSYVPPSRPFSFRHRAATALLAHHLFQPSMSHIYNAQGKKQSLKDLLSGPAKGIWSRSSSNEFGRLAQGNDFGIEGTNTIQFIVPQQVPIDGKVTYASFVCDYRPLKKEQYRVRLVVGGDKLSYDDDVGSPAASLLETKLLINSVISDAKKGARFLTCDIKDFFLATPMSRPEFMKIHISNFPADIIERYHLHNLVDRNGYVFIQINKGMYGLKQASVLAYDLLVKNLKKDGYHPIPHTVGLWSHSTKNIYFCLCVDDFGIKYTKKSDADHLLNSLKKHYSLSIDWSGNNFCGLTLDWFYKDGYVDVSMPNYIAKVLDKFNHPPPSKPQCSPYLTPPFNPLRAGQRQYASAPDPSPHLDGTSITRVQAIVGSLLYYGRAIDNTILPALNTIAQQQSRPTTQTMDRCSTLLDYTATYPTAFIRYYASDMVLSIDSDAAYLVEPQSRSRVAGYFQLNSLPTFVNGALLIECKTLRHVVASSAEAETAGLFHNAQIAVPIRYMLNQLGHPQPATPLKTDNSTANSFVHNNLTQKRSKSWDMRYYWLRDQDASKQFTVYWDKGINNHADYYTKHHPVKVHKTLRPRYVLDRSS
jgi:hypothetical protein